MEPLGSRGYGGLCPDQTCTKVSGIFATFISNILNLIVFSQVITLDFRQGVLSCCQSENLFRVRLPVAREALILRMDIVPEIHRRKLCRDLDR